MTVPELLAALAELRTTIAADIRAKQGAGGTLALSAENAFVVEAARLGWQTGTPPTIYALLKSIEYAHAQISIETFRDGESETARHMAAAMAANAADPGGGA